MLRWTADECRWHCAELKKATSLRFALNIAFWNEWLYARRSANHSRLSFKAIERLCLHSTTEILYSIQNRTNNYDANIELLIITGELLHIYSRPVNTLRKYHKSLRWCWENMKMVIIFAKSKLNFVRAMLEWLNDRLLVRWQLRKHHQRP